MKNKRFIIANNDGVSEWVENFYNKYLPDSGIFVEIGVGHTIDRHWGREDTLRAVKNKEKIHKRCGSNTLDLLDYGFFGVYIEPIIEFCCELELITGGKKNKILNYGCSDKEEILSLYGGETFVPNRHLTWPGGVDYIGREVKCNTLSNILDDEKINCDNNIALMSLDAEGWEMKILKGMRKEHMPKMMIVEIDKKPEIVDFLLERGYELCHRDNRDAGLVKIR